MCVLRLKIQGRYFYKIYLLQTGRLKTAFRRPANTFAECRRLLQMRDYIT
ncbi:Uncharacterised protein [Neisseria zoodegmatis]|uniref:Uncharacterized protein n=1 Tax=Neisseria zoodegmatis TaxID=326523 RepID=A0A378WG40_9NEIS|nr:Uncharacterised protein [Neisseria zoodegmatis]